METSTTEDFLSVDKPVPGQNFVCLSFVSPEKILKKRENYNFYKFLKEKYTFDEEFETFEKQYEDYLSNQNSDISEEFNKIENFKTSIRGIKVRGTYDTQKEASVRAKVLQNMDPSFHVFVGQVGYWLPWDPEASDVADQQYQEEHLNNLVGRYKENEIERDNYYAQETEERKKKCAEDNLKSRESGEAAEETSPTEVSETVDNLIDNLNNGDSHNDLKADFESYKKENGEKVD